MSTTINQRFAQLIQYLGITKNAFAMSLDKTASVIQHLLDGRNKPGFDLLQRVFEVYPNVSRDWVMLGQGPMLLTGQQPTVLAAAPAPAPAPTPVPELETAAPVTAAAPVPQLISVQAAPAPAPELPLQAAPQPVVQAAALAPAPVAAPMVTMPNPEAYMSAALHTQHLQHQLALAELRNQHLLEQQQMLRQMLELAQRAA